MKISFRQLLQPREETIWVNGEPFLLGKSYPNIVKEDNNIIITFEDGGGAHLQLKQYLNAHPRVRYIEGNNFLNTFFPNALKLTTQKETDKDIFFGFIDFRCRYNKDGQIYERSVNIENALTVYKDGKTEYNGINFFITETLVKDNKNKKRRKSEVNNA